MPINEIPITVCATIVLSDILSMLKGLKAADVFAFGQLYPIFLCAAAIHMRTN